MYTVRIYSRESGELFREYTVDYEDIVKTILEMFPEEYFRREVIL